MKCSQCGKCCEKIALGRINNYTAEGKEYLRAHGVEEDQGFFLIPFKCPHLMLTVKPGEDVDIGYVPTVHICDIHDKKPKICQQFDGKKFKNHILYWVPKGCTMREK